MQFLDQGFLRESVADKSPHLSHLKIESLIPSYSNNFKKGQRASASQLHTVVFAIKKKQVAMLTKILDDISNPFSPNYGKHLTMEEVTQMTSNLEGSHKLLNFLENHPPANDGRRMEVLKMTPNKDYITAQAPVELWESFFNTEFYEFQHKKLDKNGQ